MLTTKTTEATTEAIFQAASSASPGSLFVSFIFISLGLFFLIVSMVLSQKLIPFSKGKDNKKIFFKFFPLTFLLVVLSAYFWYVNQNDISTDDKFRDYSQSIENRLLAQNMKLSINQKNTLYYAWINCKDLGKNDFVSGDGSCQKNDFLNQLNK